MQKNALEHANDLVSLAFAWGLGIHRKRCDIGAIGLTYDRRARFGHFIDAMHRVQWNVKAVHTRKTAFQLLFGGVYNHGGLGSEYRLGHLDKTPESAGANAARAELVDLTFAGKNNAIKLGFSHGRNYTGVTTKTVARNTVHPALAPLDQSRGCANLPTLRNEIGCALRKR